MQGSPTVGGATGPINGSKATDYNGSTQWGVATMSVPGSTPLTMIHHGNADTNALRLRSMGVADTSADNDEHWDLEWRGDVASDLIQAHAGNANAAASLSGFTTGAWHQAVGRFTASNDRNAGVNGVVGGANTGVKAPTSIDSISVGALKQLTGRNPFDGKLSMVFLHTAAAAQGVTDAWIAYHKEMLDDADQSDFYGSWSWKAGTSPVNALALGFKAEDPQAADENAALLAEACKARRLIIWPAGDFYFHKIATANNSTFDQIAWKGAASEYAWQHQEQDGQGDKQLTRFVLVDMAEDDVWLDMYPRRATRIGPWRIENITFQIPANEEGNMFRIGDPADQNAVGVTIRGLNVKGCYFTFVDHVSASYMIEDGANGWVLNRPHGRNYAWHVTKGYDIAFEDISTRGFYTNEFRHCDRFLARNWRGGRCGRVLDLYGIGAASVPAAVFGLWCEGSWIVGANLESCEVHSFNSESGYTSSYVPRIGERDLDNDNAPLGSDANPADDDPRRLPASVGWTIDPGAGSIEFSGFGMGVDATDYFEPRTVIRIEPTTAGEEPRLLYIDSVDADEVLFRNATTTSYIHAELEGNGEGITRWFGSGVNLVGDHASISGHNVHVNQILGDLDANGFWDAPGDFPMGFIVPGSTSTIVSGGGGSTKNSDDDTTRWAVVADDYGVAHSLCGGVRWIGQEAPDHPLVLKDGDQHLEWHSSIRSMEIERMVIPVDTDADGDIDEHPGGIRHRAFPGRGITSSWSSSRYLRFRKRMDTALNKMVPVHRLLDGPTPIIQGSQTPTWMIPGLSKPDQLVDYTIRFYASSATAANNDLVVWGGVSGDSFNDRTQGWHTVSGQLDAGQTDASGEVWLAGANIEVAWVELWQEE
jgi:hypothetical protein